MKLKQFVFIFLVQLINISTAIDSMPSKCWLWDSACLKLKAQAISPILAAGVPEFDVQPLDGIIIDFVHLDKGGYQADLRTVRIKGMSDAIVDSVNVDVSKNIVNLVFHTDFDISSRYINNGTVLSTPIYGDGDFFMKLENVQITMNIPFEIIKDAQGKNVMNLKSFEYKYDVIKYVQYHLENLYNGDKKLSDMMHDKICKNWKFLIIQYGPFLFDPLIEKIFYSIRNYVRSEPLGTVALYSFK